MWCEKELKKQSPLVTLPDCEAVINFQNSIWTHINFTTLFFYSKTELIYPVVSGQSKRNILNVISLLKFEKKKLTHSDRFCNLRTTSGIL